MKSATMTTTMTLPAVTKPLRIIDVVTKDTKEALEARKLLSISNLKSAIPAEAFVKSLPTSLAYMAFDYTMILLSTAALVGLMMSGSYAEMAVWQKLAITTAHWLFSGFFMWCIFVVGHDCGHGTFSNYTLLNDVIGHVCHGSILVPFYPWRLSHHRHHMHHNHVDNDYSHPWVTQEKIDSGEWPIICNVLGKHKWLRAVLPIFGWPAYLLGHPDGNHWWPYAEGNRLFQSTPTEHVKCLMSTAVVIVNFALVLHLCDYDLATMFQLYLGPVLVFGWWLNCVTYLQHHDHDTVVYDDSNWNFALAAFETVDRKFGFGIDAMHHHITDGHVAHHLFFTKIPHYNLPIATKGLQNYLTSNKIDSVYKFEHTKDFVYRLHKYLYDFGFDAVSATAPEQPVAPFQKQLHPLEVRDQKKRT